MSRNQMLTVLVLADVVTAFSTIGSEMFFGWTLPRELQEYTGPQNMAIFSGRALILLPLWALTVGSTLVAWVGLLNHWWFARRLYLAAWIAWSVLLLRLPFSVPSSHPILVSGPSLSFNFNQINPFVKCQQEYDMM